MATQIQWKWLERDPLSSYRQLSIKGRRIKARTLYGRYKSAEDPLSIEQIASEYDLPIEAVREAIEYCDSKPIEIELDQKIATALMAAHGMNDPRYKFAPSKYYKPLTPPEQAKIIREIVGE